MKPPHRSEGFPWTGYLVPAHGTPGVLPNGESSWDAAAVAVAAAVIWKMPKYEEMCTLSQMGMSKKSRMLISGTKKRRRPNVEQSYLEKIDENPSLGGLFIETWSDLRPKNDLRDRGRPDFFKNSKKSGSGCRGSIRLVKLVWQEPFFLFYFNWKSHKIYLFNEFCRNP